MALLFELKDKKEVIEELEKVISHGISDANFTQIPKINIKIFFRIPLFRIMLMTKGYYKYNIFQKNKVDSVILEPGKALFCQRSGMTEPAKMDKGGRMLTFVIFPQYVRFLISDAYVASRPSYWYHTATPLRQSGVYILRALDELAATNHSGEEACHLLTALLHSCRELLIEDDKKSVGKAFQSYQNIKAYLIENMHTHINRESVANAVKLHPSHVSKLFDAYDEHNFNHALKAIRMERASELLKENIFSVDEIAEQCGFINTGYFIRVFKKFYACTPGVFRQSKHSK